jgi:hypothetical protein
MENHPDFSATYNRTIKEKGKNMIIKQTRIRNVDTHLSHIKDGESFYIALSDVGNFTEDLIKIGFTSDLEVGEKILPKSIGNITNFNANGKHNKLTDEPMEEAYYQRLWIWTDWGGYEHSKIVDIPYKRYPREFIKPPSEELSIVETSENEKFLVSDKFQKGEDNETVKHVVNMFLEIFGLCLILDEDLERFQVPEIKKLNWEILPQGEYPWEDVEEHVKESIGRAPEGKKPVIEDRVKTITNHNPNYLAIGKGGFDGYWVFGFEDEEIFILENTNYGNATYIFDDNWETYSQLTKKEILTGDIQKDRIIHREGWHDNINKLFN